MTFEVIFFSVFAGGWLFGNLFRALRLPAVLGMTLFGILLTSIITRLHGSSAEPMWPVGFWEVVPFIKSLALVIILLRAGLGISRTELKAAGMASALMAFLPCLFEGGALMIALSWLFGFSWQVAGLTAFMLAAVSPAVVVPSMLELKAQGLGHRHGVITAILAGASVDDVLAITAFTAFLGLATSGDSSPMGALGHLPLVLVGGTVIGAGLGFGLSWWFKARHDAIRATEKTILLLASSVFLVQVGHWMQLAALLGVMTAGFIILERAETQAHELSQKLAKVWVAAQIALFVVIGMSTDLSVAWNAGPKALLALALGLIARSLGVVLATAPSQMNGHERLFCVIAYLPKATVQAALGGVALASGLVEGQLILAIAVLSILVTAPLGLVGINLSARRLLSVSSND
jgi:NhaP-type Na+/H+ or K+/H+ antiporter